MALMNRFLIVGVLCLLAWPSLADDAARANRLMIDAVNLIQASNRVEKFRLLKQAHDNLVEIIDRHPSTDLAVKLATGQRIGNITLSKVHNAMEQARVAKPAKPGAPVRVWRHGAAVVAVASSPPGGQWVFAASRDGVVALRDIRTGELVGTWRHGSEMSVALSPGGRRVLTGGRDGVVALRDTRTGHARHEWQHKRSVAAVALSGARGRALVGSGRNAFVVDVRTLKILHSWRHKSPATAVAYASDGRWILAGFADGRALLGDARTGRIVHQWKHPGSGSGGIMSAAFSPDGRRVVTGAANWRATLRDIDTGRTVHAWKIDSRVTAVAYSRDGRWILTGDDEYEVELHDTASGRTVRKWRYDTSPTAVAFSADTRIALMGFADGMLILCDIRRPERRRGYERTFLTTDGGCW